MRKLNGGNHVWDKRYTNVVSPKQPFDSYGKVLVGKYAGRKINTLPVSYLKWLLINWKDLSVRNIKTIMHLVQLADKSV
jgi:uncharacterized protein (DUF3820 family)